VDARVVDLTQRIPFVLKDAQHAEEAGADLDLGVIHVETLALCHVSRAPA
jgi:hypothetical protein